MLIFSVNRSTKTFRKWSVSRAPRRDLSVRTFKPLKVARSSRFITREKSSSSLSSWSSGDQLRNALAGLLLLEAHALLKRRKGFVNSRDAVLGFCRLFREPPGSAVSEHFNALFLTHKSVFHCFLYDGLQIPFPGSTSTAPRKESKELLRRLLFSDARLLLDTLLVLGNPRPVPSCHSTMKQAFGACAQYASWMPITFDFCGRDRK